MSGPKTWQHWLERFPNRDEWWHPKSECQVRPDFFERGVAIALVEPSPRDFRSAVAMTLPPDEARRIAAEIIKAAEVVEKMDAQAIISRVPGTSASCGGSRNSD